MFAPAVPVQIALHLALTGACPGGPLFGLDPARPGGGRLAVDDAGPHVELYWLGPDDRLQASHAFAAGLSCEALAEALRAVVASWDLSFHAVELPPPPALELATPVVALPEPQPKRAAWELEGSASVAAGFAPATQAAVSGVAALALRRSTWPVEVAFTFVVDGNRTGAIALPGSAVGATYGYSRLGFGLGALVPLRRGPFQLAFGLSAFGGEVSVFGQSVPNPKSDVAPAFCLGGSVTGSYRLGFLDLQIGAWPLLWSPMTAQIGGVAGTSAASVPVFELLTGGGLSFHWPLSNG